MPNSLTSSFASAAAGATSDTSHRRDAPSANEWSRSRINGTTFRRTSTQSRDNLGAAAASTSNSTAAPSTTTGVYIPPHLNTQANVPRNGPTAELRYSRDESYEIYHGQKEAGLLGVNISSVFTGPWDPRSTTNTRSDSKDPGPEVCWNPVPSTEPLGLTEMDESEKQLFSTSVNSPLKMTNAKESGPPSLGARKTSLSAVNTTGGSRPGTRRRETSDSFAAGNGPLSPIENKTFRLDQNANTPPPALLRRRTDHHDELNDKDEPQASKPSDSPFGSLRRTGTGPLSAGLNAPAASPWATGSSGAFGAFSNAPAESAPSDVTAPQRPGFGTTRSTSRFKDILSKPGDDASPSIKEKQSFGALKEMPEEEDQSAKMREPFKNRPNRSETNPYDDGLARSGSAALSAHDEPGIEQMGFSAYNQHQTPYHNRLQQDQTSPTNTNPYQSPHGGRLSEEDSLEQHPNAPGYGRRDVFAADHRPQGSFGSIRGPSSSLSGFGGFPGWDNPGFGSGTPGRERPPVSVASAFGDPVFSPLGGLQSPGGAFGGNNSLFGGGSAFGRGAGQGRLGLPFPPAMQDQMRSDSRNDAFTARADPFEARRQDSFRGAFDEMRRTPADEAFHQAPVSRSPTQPQKRSGSNSPTGSGAENEIPEAQQRQMVMPDRMLWVYRDPSGIIQGPFTGLEMHDWFKAGFFTAELQIKKVEDRDYEPLAQLIRRIGNSREPFLVPQIGIPHGPSQGQPPVNPLFASTPASSAQPPFPTAFPNFGTTLTAEQQNALERRKQEEQTLMAAQKEWLAQHKLTGGSGRPGSMQFPGPMHSLQHHSSAHSLHSQPSFGSITSPAGYQPSPLQAPIQPPQSGNSFQQSSTHPLENLSGQFGRMGLENRGPYGGNAVNQQSFAAHERNRLSMENAQNQYNHENTFLGQGGRNERLEEFQDLRRDMEEDESEDELESSHPQPIGSQRPVEDAVAAQKASPGPGPIGKPPAHDEPLSLAQQVQRTAAANMQAAEESEHFETPPVSVSPLPAPAAQRSRPPVAEQLAADNRSAAQTPIEHVASVAPWADKADHPKGPSLREIQEAEAKRAAEQEALLVEARRAQLEQEQRAAAAAAAAAVVPTPTPGLPLTSTWASSGSPATPTTPGGGVWAKPVVAKPTTSSKKTLAQIQKEEEARKLKAAAQAAQAAQIAAITNPTVPVGNRYAQMASKASPAPSITPMVGSAWTTVGASGKPKTPATIVAAPPAPQRAVSTTTVRPVASRSSSIALSSSGPKEKAREDLIKWAKAQLARGLKKDTNADDLVNTLMSFPVDLELTSDVVYQASDTLDGRRFAEEFIRRRKLADKGVVAENVEKSNGNGWSEVAKKVVAPKEEPGFKVVSKKKGGKK